MKDRRIGQHKLFLFNKIELANKLKKNSFQEPHFCRLKQNKIEIILEIDLMTLFLHFSFVLIYEIDYINSSTIKAIILSRPFQISLFLNSLHFMHIFRIFLITSEGNKIVDQFFKLK